jgi:pimeloyl-ACP methyl ester carboxylesterase
MIKGKWQQQVGSQRDWVWRGWQTRYSYQRSAEPSNLPPVLLLHGFGASIGHWQHNFDFLAAQHSVYALDLIGFGASRKPQLDYDIELWVEQVHAFWQEFIGVPMVLVGNSIGSLVALVAAARYPDLAVTTVMIGLPDLSAEQELIPKPLQPLVNGIKRTIASPLLLRPLFRVVSQPWVAKRWARIAYANRERVDDELLDLFLTPARERESAAAFVKIIQGMTSTNFSPNVRQLLPEINIPMLLIWGSEDRMIPPGTSEVMLELNPMLKLLPVEGAGHCAHHELPEVVNQMMRNWLDGLVTAKMTPERQPTCPTLVNLPLSGEAMPVRELL